MARKATGWTCRRATCKFRNPPRTRKCQRCGNARPVRKPPAHAAVLQELTYEDFIEVNGGIERCGICNVRPSATRRLDRDHDHDTGEPRGLLCHQCNRALKYWMTLQWLRKAVAYLERALERAWER